MPTLPLAPGSRAAHCSVVAVLGVVGLGAQPGFPGAVRGIPPAHVLADNDVAPVHILLEARLVLAVGRSRHEHGIGPSAIGPVYIGAQHDAVAHDRRDVGLDDDPPFARRRAEHGEGAKPYTYRTQELHRQGSRSQAGRALARQKDGSEGMGAVGGTHSQADSGGQRRCPVETRYPSLWFGYVFAMVSLWNEGFLPNSEEKRWAVGSVHELAALPWRLSGCRVQRKRAARLCRPQWTSCRRRHR